MTTQSTAIVTPLSPSHIVMLAMLAQHGPLAKRSVMRKWNRLTKPKFRSRTSRRLPADSPGDLQPGGRRAVLPPPLDIGQAGCQELETVEEPQDLLPGPEIGLQRRARRHRAQFGHGPGVASHRCAPRRAEPAISSERAGFLLTRHIEPACAEQCLTAADPDSS